MVDDPTWATTARVVDSLVLLDETWVRVSAIEAVRPTKAYAPPAALIELRNGNTLPVSMEPKDVVEALKKVLR